MDSGSGPRPYPSHNSISYLQQASAKPSGDITPPATPALLTPLKAGPSPFPHRMQENPLAEGDSLSPPPSLPHSPHLSHPSPSMQDDSSQTDSLQAHPSSPSVELQNTPWHQQDPPAALQQPAVGAHSDHWDQSGYPNPPASQTPQPLMGSQPQMGAHSDQWDQSGYPNPPASLPPQPLMESQAQMGAHSHHWDQSGYPHPQESQPPQLAQPLMVSEPQVGALEMGQSHAEPPSVSHPHMVTAMGTPFGGDAVGEIAAAQEAHLATSEGLESQLQTADLATMQSDEILMVASGESPIPGGLVANPMFDAPARGVSGARCESQFFRILYMTYFMLYVM